MYGYVRPAKDELKVKEFERFRSAYCGLCETLRRRCGLAARFVVNYDLTFLVMALSPPCRTQERRCLAHPVSKRPCLCGDALLDDAADYSVILAWWKLRDDLCDGTFPERVRARAAMLFLRRAYRAASVRNEAFDKNTQLRLAELRRLEEERSDSIDQTADCFAAVLTNAAEKTEDPARKRLLKEVFYHVGRCVYLLDAADDLPKDIQSGSYNPLIFRWGLTEGLTEPVKEELAGTINVSLNMALRALDLREADEWQPILENIVSLGIPRVRDAVFSGVWKKRKRKNTPERSGERI